MILLPIAQEGAHFQFTTELDGVTFTFEFRWNSRDSAWYMSIGDGEGVPIVSSVKVVVNLKLIGRFGLETLPAGDIMAFDTSGAGLDPGFEDLGRRVLVYFVPFAEL